MTETTPPTRPGTADWKARIAGLRARRRQMRQVARALGLDADSPKGQVLCEFLLGEIFGQALEKRRSPSALLRELQQVLKAVPTNSTSRKKKASAPKRSLKHHLEQLYGPGVVVVEEVTDDKDEKETRPKKAR